MMAEGDNPQTRLLSVAEVARVLSVTEPTVREWIKSGKLHAHRAGARFWRIRQSEVDRMLSEQASNRPAATSGGPGSIECRPHHHLSNQQPRRAVGEIVIIGVTPTTATGMIVFSLEDVHAGDGVEADQVN